MRRGLDEENIVYSSVLAVYQAVLMRQYQFFRVLIEVSNMVKMGVSNYGL